MTFNPFEQDEIDYHDDRKWEHVPPRPAATPAVRATRAGSPAPAGAPPEPVGEWARILVRHGNEQRVRATPPFAEHMVLIPASALDEHDQKRGNATSTAMWVGRTRRYEAGTIAVQGAVVMEVLDEGQRPVVNVPSDRYATVVRVERRHIHVTRQTLVRDRDGDWHDIDSTDVQSGDEVTAHAVEVIFPGVLA